MTNSWEILGGDILGDTGFQTGVLHIDEGKISNDPAKNMLPYNAEDAWILPGIVDLHGDGFETIVEPRPGVHFPFELAYREADRQMISNGITTGFHALTISWEPGLRDISVSRALWSALHSISGSLDCDARFNLRWETFALDHVDEVIGWLSAQSGDILSINDHTTANHGLSEDSAKLKRMAARMGLSPAEAQSKVAEVWARREEVPAATDDICARAAKLGRTAMSHDDATPQDRQIGRIRNLTVSEFPTTLEAAQEARAAGEQVIMGAPNALRGHSHNGALCATQAIKRGLCTILASDYYYPAQFYAAFRLADEGVLPLDEAWALVSTNPAAAVGLTDRGTLSAGKRADLLVVDKETRKIKTVFVEGRRVLDRS
ncbi:alpha-D-ribose 1-methylphosphonate 5-triphosphate diphosphatase [Celeribacter halophilus]|jgi:alpha-D-ribose 1-methylphosphonate 5-triphosphate diphosphatase|uniref:alpha-D-ribose 1-methylphosphonate 5-triphosphate diphosphatase n=1 Tax=Celeribacter halophilus TaxID=576117 RepID=UPI003A8E2080